MLFKPSSSSLQVTWPWYSLTPQHTQPAAVGYRCGNKFSSRGQSHSFLLRCFQSLKHINLLCRRLRTNGMQENRTWLSLLSICRYRQQTDSVKAQHQSKKFQQQYVILNFWNSCLQQTCISSGFQLEKKIFSTFTAYLSCQENSFTGSTHLTLSWKEKNKKQVYIHNLNLKMTSWLSVLIQVMFFVSQPPFIIILFWWIQRKCIFLWPWLHCDVGSMQTNCAWPVRETMICLILGRWVSCLCSKDGSEVLVAGICSFNFLVILTANCRKALSGNANTGWRHTGSNRCRDAFRQGKKADFKGPASNRVTG